MTDPKLPAFESPEASIESTENNSLQDIPIVQNMPLNLVSSDEVQEHIDPMTAMLLESGVDLSSVPVVQPVSDADTASTLSRATNPDSESDDGSISDSVSPEIGRGARTPALAGSNLANLSERPPTPLSPVTSKTSPLRQHLLRKFPHSFIKRSMHVNLNEPVLG